MVITREWIGEHATGNNVGWTRQQLRCLGVSWPPRSGWRRAMAGRVIPDEAAREFERLGAEQRRKVAAQVIENDASWGAV